MPKAFYDLNTDVLQHILQFVLMPDVSRFMRTCHGAYDLALPFFTASVDLRWNPSYQDCCDDKLHGFCNFMLAESNSLEDRPSRLRELRVSLPTHYRDVGLMGERLLLPPSVAVLFAGVLARAINLVYLDLTESEVFFLSHPSIADALINQCPKLARVSFGQSDRVSMATKWQMRHLKHISLRCSLLGIGGLLESFACRPTSLEISVSIPVKLHGDQWGDLVWPQVESLSLSGGTMSANRISQIFPNLRRLQYRSGAFGGWWKDRRELRVAKEPLLWKELDYLESGDYTVWHSNLKCHVRELCMPFPGSNVQDTTFTEAILEILRDTTPISVSLTVSTMAPLDFFIKIPQTLEKIQFLEICLLAVWGDDEVAPRIIKETVALLVHLPDAFSKLRATYLRMLFRLPQGYLRAIGAEPQDAFVCELARCVPALEYVDITWESRPDSAYKSKWYRFEEREGRPRQVAEIADGHILRNYWRHRSTIS
ncbi:hypothetical protein NEOLEDRAFT_1169663 [Neolentinus lepideus HHB14362 ss-1]|uniref:F-box domain-containing protein n=1 Tax=Neolentinus lepideus HHB14362 ss-1 TaxID=1314782 RepID=A0A165SIY5_9AGAM|nr:hypothetical protein NEOLEDRAFT_1169663 [Neolentinus lepideus HHB14362 ss-1]